jgi:spermidine/putrescine ABC transporter ATP-binding subunit
MTQNLEGSCVRLQNLTKWFGDILAVDNVNLQADGGEFITLLGPSGSGKTTTLMMIAGFEIPNKGEIFVNDEKIMLKPSYKRGIGIVFQNYSLFPHMTVERNVGFPLRMRKVEKRETQKRIRDVLELVKLADYEKRFPKQLSGGQQQRVALARALVFNPTVLLMDEPLGALDRKLREHMQLEIKEITQSLNITVIYVTHDQGEALAMSDRIAVMNNGKIEQTGTAIDIYDNPANYFVADFIGESNFIIGNIVENNHRGCHFMSQGGLIFKSLFNQDKFNRENKYLAIRPEKISIVEEGESFPNQFVVMAEEVVYLGDIIKLKARLMEDGTELLIKQQNKSNTRQVKKGEKVSIGWKEEDSCIL